MKVMHVWKKHDAVLFAWQHGSCSVWCLCWPGAAQWKLDHPVCCHTLFINMASASPGLNLMPGAAIGPFFLWRRWWNIELPSFLPVVVHPSASHICFWIQPFEGGTGPKNTFNTGKWKVLSSLQDFAKKKSSYFSRGSLTMVYLYRYIEIAGFFSLFRIVFFIPK